MTLSKRQQCNMDTKGKRVKVKLKSINRYQVDSLINIIFLLLKAQLESYKKEKQQQQTTYFTMVI